MIEEIGMKLYRGYGVLKRLRQGVRIYIYPTLRCNLKCKYCVNLFYNGERPTSSEISWMEWMRIISDFPVFVREVVLSGGEPMLYSQYTELANAIVSSGRFLTVYTNLMLKKGLSVEPSVRIRLDASFHESVDSNLFLNNLQEYRKKFRVDTNEIEKNEIRGSVVKRKLQTKKDIKSCLERRKFCFSPDGRLCLSLGEAYEHCNQ